MSSHLVDITRFLRTAPIIKKINFDFGGVKIWPEGYSKHVCNALDSGAIQVVVTNDIEAGAGGAYNSDTDTLKVRPSFSMSDPGCQGLVIHELAHALVDIQAIAGTKLMKAEGASYLAQATFLEDSGYSPGKSSNLFNILTIAQSIAVKTVLSGAYMVSATDVAALESSMLASPLYAGKASELFISNGMTRSVGASINRSITRLTGS